MKKKSEKFVDVVPNDKFNIIIFVNPTTSEFKSIPSGARGYVDINGDLYIEGYEEEDFTGFSRVIHEQFLMLLVESNLLPKATLKRIKYLLANDFHDDDVLEDCDKYGLCVVRKSNSFSFTVAESYDYDIIMNDDSIQETIGTIFYLVEKKNSRLEFRI